MAAFARRLLHNTHLLLLTLALVLLAGVSAWQSLPRIEDPRITTRNATVVTVVPGATAERVEALVTKKLEDALREVAEVKTLESTSSGGVSIVNIELDDTVTAADNERIFAELAALGLTIDDVAARLAGADTKDSAGALHSDAQLLRITVDGELDAMQRVAAVPLVTATDGLVAVGDIATVSRGVREPPTEIAWADGRRVILLGIRTRDAVRARRTAGAAPEVAVADSVRHLGVPLAASTLTTMLGFMPIFLLPGNIGDFIGPIAVSVMLALAASFVISMTLIPALAGLVAAPPGRGFWQQGVTSPGTGRAYGVLLRAALRHPMLTTALCLVLPVAGFAAAGQLGLQFFPPAERDQFEVQVWAAEESSVSRTAASVLEVEAAIRAAGDVQSVFWVAGGSSPPVYYNQLRNQDRNAAYARGTVQATSQAEAARLVGALQRHLPERFPALRIVVRSFGQGPPISAPIAVRLMGPDVRVLQQLGDEMRRILHRLPEVTESIASIGPDAKTLAIAADERDAALAGLSLGAIATQYRTALEGAVGGRVLEDVRDLPVRVRYDAEQRDDPTVLATLPLVAARSPGEWIPAAALGDLRLAPETAAITRRDGERVNIIEAWLTPALYRLALQAGLVRVPRSEVPYPHSPTGCGQRGAGRREGLLSPVTDGG